jgi:16S rRNA (guanine1207-N2)-methyltransferase
VFEESPGGEQYFAERPRSPHRRRELRFLYRGQLLSFETDRGIFAHEGLDPGTSLLIESLDPAPADRVLDLGCGWGALGIAAARAAPRGEVVMTDVNRRAVLLARQKARFDLIVTNPPYHAGRETVLAILAGAPDHLLPGGRLLVVGKGSQGIQFYQRWLSESWAGGSVVVRGRGGGYRVLEARPGPVNRQR